MTKAPYLFPASLQDGLACLEQVAESDRLAIDLEFDREQHTYGFTLCLLQIATPAHCVLIDPFIEGLLSPFLQWLSQSPAIKLMHSSGEDIRLLHTLQCFPGQMEDTEIYARWLNLENTSLSAMLQTWCGITLDKQQQRSNWTKRPLSSAQLLYAVQDVQYLFQLREKLREAAAQKGVLELAEEDQRILSAQRFDEVPAYPFVKPAEYWRYSPQELHILNGMMALRDEMARKLNRPLHFVVPEKLMVETVLDLGDMDQLLRHNNVHRAVKQPRTLHAWKKRLAELKEEAAHLPRKNGQTGKNTSLAWLRQQETEVFKPIQQALEARFGSYTARYILSNRMVTQLLRKELSLPALKHPLKERLIREAAASLGIDLAAW